MRIGMLDQTIVIAYIALSVGAGLYLSRRATRSVTEYFVGGRSLPWWLAGTSMIASSFAIDTPFGITGLVAKDGLSGVWFAWAFAIGGAGTFGAFIFAALLRRSDIITTAELIELRYSGRGAAILRGFKGIYFGVLQLAISMAWVLRSVVTISEQALGWDVMPTLIVIMAITIVYTMASGFWGVAVTDFFQFFIGSAGSIALAYYAVDHIGGLEQLVVGLEQRFGAVETAQRLQFVPRPGEAIFPTFLTYVTLKWWGNPPMSLTQRIMATKDDRHATFSLFLFTIVQFAINYWPMILVALVSLATYSDLSLDQAQQGYAKLVVDVLPPGMLGVMLASLTAAFMSTIDTQANTGASFMINDIYRRFLRPGRSDKHYVRASQLATLSMLGIALIVFPYVSSVKAAWQVVATMIAGYGFVVVGRWFWWRISAWCEMASLAGSAVGTLVAYAIPGLSTCAARFCFVAAFSTISWILVALVTPPPPLEHLARFCRKVRPFRALWGPVADYAPDIEWSPHLGRNVMLWGVGLVATFSVCFGLGHLLLGLRSAGGALIALAVLLFVVLRLTWRP